MLRSTRHNSDKVIKLGTVHMRLAEEFRLVLQNLAPRPYRKTARTAPHRGQIWIVSAVYNHEEPRRRRAVEFLRFCQPDTIAHLVPDATSFFAASDELLERLWDLQEAGGLKKVEGLLRADGAPDLLEVETKFASPERFCQEFLSECVCIMHIEDGQFWVETMQSERRVFNVPFAGANLPFRVPFDKARFLTPFFCPEWPNQLN
jgi:hypothetical protein